MAFVWGRADVDLLQALLSFVSTLGGVGTCMSESMKELLMAPFLAFFDPLFNTTSRCSMC